MEWMYTQLALQSWPHSNPKKFRRTFGSQITKLAMRRQPLLKSRNSNSRLMAKTAIACRLLELLVLKHLGQICSLVSFQTTYNQLQELNKRLKELHRELPKELLSLHKQNHKPSKLQQQLLHLALWPDISTGKLLPQVKKAMIKHYQPLTNSRNSKTLHLS